VAVEACYLSMSSLRFFSSPDYVQIIHAHAHTHTHTHTYTRPVYVEPSRRTKASPCLRFVNRTDSKT